MGLNEALRGRRVCVDTNILIYLLEGSAELARPLSVIRKMLEEREAHFVVSSLTLAELLPPLASARDFAAVQVACGFVLESGAFEIVPADAEVCIEAGLLRGSLRLKTPDAIHVATCVVAACELLLTNDAGIRVPDTIGRIVLSDYS